MFTITGMSSEAIKHALRIVAGHGFEVTPMYDGVAIEMPYSAENGKVQGVERIECRSHREVFAALGY